MAYDPSSVESERRAQSMLRYPAIHFSSFQYGHRLPYSVGANFTPHIFTVNPGEDVYTQIMSFSHQGPLAMCILSANGVLSSVTLRHPDSSGGTLTYEGRFEILSLCGSFIPNESGGTRSRCGGVSVSLAGPDGHVVGGGVAGLMLAASPVQVTLGSFMVCDKHKPKKKTKTKKNKVISTVTPTATVPVSSTDPILNVSTSAVADTKNSPTDNNA